MLKNAVLGVAGLLLAAGVEQAAAQQPDAAEMQKGLAAMMQSVAAAASNSAPVVDFKELKAMLPAALTGLKRTSAKGERNGAMGMTVAQATGEYTAEAGGSVRIELQDLGGLGMAGFAAAGWQALDVDSESDDGYEKTYKYKGIKVHEEYNTPGKSGELKTLVGGRFMVSISVRDLDAAQLKNSLDKIDLAKLAALKPAAGAQK
ncbi:MAG: transposase [bacterium]